MSAPAKLLGLVALPLVAALAAAVWWHLRDRADVRGGDIGRFADVTDPAVLRDGNVEEFAGTAVDRSVDVRQGQGTPRGGP